MKQLLEAGVHFGHQTRRWNPKMKRFIFGERNGIYIIDLQQTLDRIETAYRFVRDLVADGGTSCSSAPRSRPRTRSQQLRREVRHAVRQRALARRHAHQLRDHQRARRARCRSTERMRAAGEFEAMPKKEALILSRELEKLERNLGGIRNMEQLPDAVFVIDTKKEHIAVTEANKLGIPVVAVVDTNCDPDVIQYVIPGNDDAIRAGTLMCRVIADAVEEGRFIALAASRGAGRGRRRRAGRAHARAGRGAGAPAAGRGPPPGRAAGAAEREARLAAAAGGRAADADAAEAEAATPPRRRAAEAAAPPRPPPSPTTATDSTRGVADRWLSSPPRTSQALRQATGAGMMDAKKALEENDGDLEAAAQVAAREGPGQGGQARRPREHRRARSPSLVDGNVGAIVELKCETDFVAKCARLRRPGRRARRRSSPPRARAPSTTQGRRHRRPQGHAQGEHRARARSCASRRPTGNVLDTYLHIQNGRGVNGVLVELDGGDQELAHDIAVHIAFAKPDVPHAATTCPADAVDEERDDARGHHAATRASPRQALPEDRRGPAQRLVQGAGAARAAATSRTTSRPIAQLLGDADASSASPRSRSAS